MRFLLVIPIALLMLVNYHFTARRARILSLEAEQLFKESQLLFPSDRRFEFIGATATIVARRSNGWLAVFGVSGRNLYTRIYAKNEFGEYFQFTRVEDDRPFVVHMPKSVVRSILGKDFS